MNSLFEIELKKKIMKVSHRCGNQGWCPGTLGNISYFDPKFDRVYIKRSGADLNHLELEDILTLDLNGKVLEGVGLPSKEVKFHLGIYKIRSDIKTVFHIHPTYATAYAVAGKKLPMATEAAKLVLMDVPLVSSAPSGSKELARKVTSSFKDGRIKAVLIAEHGVVVIGENLKSAYNNVSLVEDTAKVALLSSLIIKS